jgi:Na+-translocating ferredoxin:NAD+ oxidoreductase subunit C
VGVLVELKKRTLGEVMGLSKDEAVEIMSQAGILGAGDGGFPTYFKYRNLQPMLLEAVMNSIRNGLGMRESETVK